MMEPTALQILEITPNSFRIEKNNFISVLKKVGSRPFVLFSINGATRTGKSYALNFFLRYLEAKAQNVPDWFKFEPNEKFVWKSGKTRTTVGINLWSEPYFVKQGGREIAVLLMDTQGLFDEQTSARQNAIIFSLSALCSSVSIFNLSKNMDENVLQQLEFFSGYAHLVSSREKPVGTTDDSESFQKLVFLVRDFDFPEYEYGYHDMHTTIPNSKNNFCKDTFKKAGSGIAKENLYVREQILRTYRDVAACLLPHPGKAFVKNAEKSTDEDFEENMRNFIEIMNNPSHLITKRIGGREITGTEFQEYINAWAKLCEKADEHFPKVQSIMESTAIIQNTLAIGTAQSQYEKQMEEFLLNNPNGVDEFLLRSEHKRALQESMETFKETRKIGDDATSDHYKNLLLNNIEKLFESHQRHNANLQQKAMIEKEYAVAKEKVQGLEQDMQKKSIEMENTQRELENQKKQAEEKFKKIDRDNLKAREELQAEIAATTAKAEAKMAKQREDQLRLEGQIQKSQLELLEVKNSSEEAQEALRKKIKDSENRADQSAKEFEATKLNMMSRIEESKKEMERSALEAARARQVHEAEMKTIHEKNIRKEREAEEDRKRAKAEIEEMMSKVKESENRMKDAQESERRRPAGGAGLFGTIGQVLDSITGGGLLKL